MTSKSEYNIKKIINDIEKKNNHEKYLETLFVMKDVEQFIRNKKLMLYGGFALNLLLPNKHKIYTSNNINDYDCYSKNAQKDAYELANLLNEKGYNYIQVKKAFHENTFRVYVNFIQVIDITNIDSDLYDKLFNITLEERKLKTSIYKYYKKNNLYIVPFVLLKRNLHFEMSRPKGSYYRWEKVYPRLKILSKHIKIRKDGIKKKEFIKIKSNDLKKCYNVVLNYIKKNKLPLIGSYPLKLLKNIKTNDCCRLNELSNQFTFYSENFEKTRDEVIELLNNNIDKNKFEVYYNLRNYLPDILPNRYRILIKNKITNNTISIANIIKLENECLSIKKIKGFNIGTIDTILYYYYSIYIIYSIYSLDNTNLEDTLYIIIEYEKMLEKININERLSKICYGKDVPRIELLKKQWMKKQEVYYPKKSSFVKKHLE